MIDLKIHVVEKPSLFELNKYIREGLKRGASAIESDVKSYFGTGFTPKVRTGALKRSIKSSVQSEGNLHTATISANTVYARIQEKGGTIKAGAGKYLKFRIEGQFKQVKSVTIPARPYLKPGIMRNLNLLKEMIVQSIVKGNSK